MSENGKANVVNSNIEIQQPTGMALAPAANSPSLMTVIGQLVLRPDADIDKIQRLLEMQERWDDRVAERAYNKAFAQFKSEAVSVVKNIVYTDGPLKGKRYADLSAVVDATSPLLSKYGLSTSWMQTKDDRDWIEVTCILRHELGHTQTVSMGGPPDVGPARNPVQARKSTTSYLERYTLLAITGLATEDDDGVGGSGMDKDDREIRLKAIKTAKDIDTLKTVFLAASQVATDAKDTESLRLFGEAKNQRLKEIPRA